MVLGLVDLSEVVSQCHEGHAPEVFFTTMHWAIVTAAHKSAASWPLHTFTMRPDGLRRDWIREKFESDLRSILSSPDRNGWNPEDVVLVERYFAETQTTS